MRDGKKFHLLIIEDNEADQNLFEYLFSNCEFDCVLHFASNGMDGSNLALRRGAYVNEPMPDLIIMDLNLPQKDGRELLKEFKADKTLSNVPIIMVSTSNSPREVCDAYSLGVSAFISKAINIDDFQDTINTLAKFWFKCAVLPTAGLSKPA